MYCLGFPLIKMLFKLTLPEFFKDSCWGFFQYHVKMNTSRTEISIDRIATNAFFFLINHLLLSAFLLELTTL